MAADEDAQRCESLKLKLEAFAQGSEYQLPLPPSNSHERYLVHTMAAELGLTTKSFGVGKHRHICVFNPEVSSEEGADDAEDAESVALCGLSPLRGLCCRCVQCRDYRHSREWRSQSALISNEEEEEEGGEDCCCKCCLFSTDALFAVCRLSCRLRRWCCCARLRWERPEKKWPFKLLRKVFWRDDNPYGPGACWHCGTPLNFEIRGHNKPNSWEVDHWPVPRRDINGQLCCGVVDTTDKENLVPSCLPCNRGHEFEPSFWWWCGRAQAPCGCCPVVFMFLTGGLLFGLLVAEALLNGHLVSKPTGGQV
eukprot:gnl/TRDRNA2_/TRDRNA2_91961_c0_seq3.p1 gnl/TRDRNA2_/TRDRNA2_91961_c0~~gnl/TRDRNA2_/TRDRNA2_91961_c0_seq3.p1  ORF type:complete len:309 (+),score=30.51 gnl/TRDRNA2_/TRDRNA2_91961_c0_seq3:90-1016(+)